MRLGLSSAAFYGRREVEDTAALLPGYDVILVARVKAVHTPYRKLEDAYRHLAAQLGLLTEDRR